MTCLIVLKNFRGLTIHPPPTLPVILRREVPTWVWTTDLGFESDNKKLSWMPMTRNSSGYITMGDCHIFTFSDFISNSGYPTRCTKIDYVRFSTKSKPWNCQFNVDIFPPDTKKQNQHSNNLGVYPTIWNWQVKATDNYGSRSKTLLLSSSSPTFQFYVVTADFLNNLGSWGNTEMIFTWISGGFPFNSEEYQLKSDIPIHYRLEFFLMELENSRVNEFYSEEQPVNDIESLQYLQICLCCLYVQFVEAIEVSLESPLNIDQFSYIGSSAYHWRIKEEGSPSRTRLYKYLCRSYTPSHLAGLAVAPNARDVLYLVVAAMSWGSVLGNFSYQYELGHLSGVYCMDRKLLKYSDFFKKYGQTVAFERDSLFPSFRTHFQQSPNPVQISFYVSNEFGALRFVSCGFRGREGMAFDQLLNVYDIYTWFAILVSIAVIMISISGFTST